MNKEQRILWEMLKTARQTPSGTPIREVVKAVRQTKLDMQDAMRHGVILHTEERKIIQSDIV